MAQQLIGIGSAPNDGTGDTLRAAFVKCNENFTEVYAGSGDVTGPASSTDNALARFHETGGKTLQDSAATVSDNGALTLTGTTVTASEPILNVTQTWNSSGVTFTGLKADITDTASASGSLLLDLQVGGASKFSIEKSGRVLLSEGGATLASAALVFGGTLSMWAYKPSSNIIGWGAVSTVYYRMNSSIGFELASGNYLGWGAGTLNSASIDLKIYRDAANTLAQRNSTSAQAYRLYNTYTNASNYERLAFVWDSNTAKIQTEAAGTGTLRDLSIGSTGGKLAFLGASPVVRQAHVADADTAHALNATFSDTEVEAALNALGTKINSILATLEAFGLQATS